MATIKFLLQSQSEQSNIYVRLSIDRQNVYKRKTGFIIDSKNWSKIKGHPLLNDEDLKNQKNDLDKFKTELEKTYNDAVKQGLIINAQWLEEQIEIINNKTVIGSLDILTNYIQFYIDSSPTRKNQKGGTGLSYNRIKSIKNFLRIITDYQKIIKKEILIREVSPTFANNLKVWLFEKGYMTNYVGKNLSILRTVCRDADKNNIDTHPKLRFLETISENTNIEDIITLSFDELNRISNTKIIRLALINARKWLILGCSIGQRGSDLLNITDDNIKVENGIKKIVLVQKKTGKKIKVAVLPEAENIIKMGLPYKISLQKFNDHLKDICEIAILDNPTKGKRIDKKTKRNKVGIYPKYKLIASHVCRRSFATNYYNIIPTSLLINATGHSTEGMFLKYIGESDNDTAKEMLEHVNKFQQRKPQPQMKVVKTAN
jgi:integrase